MNGKALWNTKGGRKVQERKPAGHGQAVNLATRAVVAIVGAVFLAGAMVAPLCAQSYPNRPIRLIIPLAPGGSTDILGRIVAQSLTERLGQSVVMDNRAGAGGNIGAEFVANSKPDGYTLLLAATPIALGPSIYKKLNYDPIKDLAPISLVAQGQPYLLVVRPSLPINSVKELVEYAKANPGKLSFGSSGIGATPHLVAEKFRSSTKINIVHVPYKGGAQALVGMMSGETDMQMATPTMALPQVKAGKLRVLAVLKDSNERFPQLPDVPTTKEAGIDNCEVVLWFGLLAPAGTPRDIINRLNAEWVKSAATPNTKEQLQKSESEPLSSTPEQFSEFIKLEIARWAKVVKAANISVTD